MAKKRDGLLHDVQLQTRVYETDGLKQKLRQPALRSDRVERAVAIKALFRRDRELEKPFGEIVALCETAGAEVVDEISQNLERANARSYLGKGKIEEIAARVKELDVDIVVADNDLSPAQERNLEKVFKCPVIDRSQLILDIFARRASTAQAKLQVELAQLRYTYPRLKRMWTHLERFEGGIGMRGPGETQLETDKRLIQRRIQRLQRKLDDIEKKQKVTMRRRPDEFVVALAGYTNVGKSTLLNRLTGSVELVEDKLFATLDTRTRKWPIDNNRHVLLKDTVGFIRELPHHLVASFHATLAETQQANLIFHVVDASASDAARQIAAVHEVLKKLDCHEKRTWLILNKWDRVAVDRRAEAWQLASCAHGGDRCFALSAAEGSGTDDLRAAIGEYLERDHRRFHLLIPHARGDLFSFVQRHGRVLKEEVRDDGLYLEFEMGPTAASKLRSLYPVGFAETNDSEE